MTMIPAARTEWVGRKSTDAGHNGSNKSPPRLMLEYVLREFPAHATMGIDIMRVTDAVAIRSAPSTLDDL